MSLTLTKNTPTNITSYYSTSNISETLMQDIAHALKSVDSFGSVEIYVQDAKVTQITTRTIKKTNGFARKPHVS